MMIVVAKRPAATNRDEPRIADLGKDHLCCPSRCCVRQRVARWTSNDPGSRRRSPPVGDYVWRQGSPATRGRTCGPS
jgi:hypothetical protein